MHRTHQPRYELRRAGLIRVPTRETMTFAYWMLIAAAMHRGGNAQLACDLAQRPTAAHQQGYRFLLELIRKMTPSLAHSTPFRSRRSLAKVSTNSGEPHYFRGLLRLHSRYGPSDCSTAQGGLCHEASIQPVARPNRSSATRAIDNSLDGSFLHW